MPSCWFDGGNCYWPNVRDGDSQSLSKYVRLGYKPNSDWKLHPAKLRKAFGKGFI